ncbi:unnamed protein product [Urochloa decumbens]|uniref:F-box domain-containing protein n=1 Tax=Urochloa decumbens TaxID=240449 RepID=A0ABC8ZJQ0_9POAL
MAAKRCADLPASPQSPKKIVRSVAEPWPGLPLPYIPDGLIFKILARLPTKSVIRFRSVCKAWLAIISSQPFVDAHLEISKLRPTMLIVPGEYSYRPEREGKTAFWMRFYKYNNGSIRAELVHSEQFPRGIAQWTQPLHCDGLILTLTRDQEIMIRNPLTGEFIFLPKGSHNNNKHHRVGFGFDPCSSKYKVARFFYQREYGTSESTCRFEVLTLGSNLWRQTADPPYPILAVTPAHVCGFIYWRVDLPLEMDPKVLVRFSLADETFSLIPYPPCNARPVGFIELDSKLCCSCFSKPCGVVEMWTCDNTDMPTWTRLCTVLLPQETFVPAPGGFFRAPKVTFYGKDLLIIGDHKLYQYSIGTGQVKKVAVAVENLWYYHPGSNKYQPYLGKEVAFETVNYVESLVQIRGYT